MDLNLGLERHRGGKFSVVGLGNETVRMIIIEETWYQDPGTCYVDVFSFQSQLNLPDPSSERFAFTLGFTAETGAYFLENAWVTLGETAIALSGEDPTEVEQKVGLSRNALNASTDRLHPPLEPSIALDSPGRKAHRSHRD